MTINLSNRTWLPGCVSVSLCFAATLAFLSMREAQAADLKTANRPPVQATAATSPAGSPSVDYLHDVKPILKKSCYSCHGVLKAESDLRLDSGLLITKGAAGGPIVEPGKPDESELITRIASADPNYRMPPEGELLKPAQIEVLKQWIQTGAKYPANEKPEPDPKAHWAFRPIVKPVLPANSTGSNPVDALLAEIWAKHGVQPQGLADKRTLLRRVTLDLIGLPPTAAEQAAFLADSSDHAYEKVVDRLLGSVQYGEHWGRHWMDVWRYSDWWGLGPEVRNSQKHIWHWRDWIIESLNEDLAYDEMIHQMLAADELYPTDTKKLRATGFLVRNYFYFNRTTWLDSTLEHVSKGFLGLTLNCTKCHDHKYDAFTQNEYYHLRAFFEPYQIRMDQVPGEPDPEKDGLPRAFDCDLNALTYRHVRGDDTKPDKSRALTPEVPALLDLGPIKIEPVSLPLAAYAPGLVQEFVLRDFLRDAQASTQRGRQALAAAERELSEARKVSGLQAGSGPTPIILAAETQISDLLNGKKSERWQPLSGAWNMQAGAVLSQKQIGPERHSIRLKERITGDFQARVRFRLLPGTGTRSGGFVLNAGTPEELAVLVSLPAGSRKPQLAYQQPGQPAVACLESALAALSADENFEITVRLRGNLLNVALNWNWVLAGRLKSPAAARTLELCTQNTQAEFLKFDLWPLHADVQLVETLPLSAAARQAQIAALKKRAAELLLEVAALQPTWAQACLAADRARFAAATPAKETDQLMQAAARAEAKIAVARAEAAFADAQVVVAAAEQGQKRATEEALVKLGTQIRTARKSVEKPGKLYTSLRGSHKIKGHNTESEESLAKPFPTTSTGRRTALARWITDPRHPLPARVAINHIWTRHFGKPIVPAMFEYGRRAPRPDLQPVLDYLARDLIENGWKMKRIHRLLVTSQAYRRSSSNLNAPPASLQHDPENLLVWRMNPVRMESQVVRDSLLHLAGTLDLAVGGPTIPVAQEETPRRSLYFFHSFNEQQRFLGMFDDPSVLECYRRDESVIPQQALALSNSRTALAAAERIALQLRRSLSPTGTAAVAKDNSKSQGPAGQEVEFIQASFRLILGSTPTPAETSACLETMQTLTALYREQKQPHPGERAQVQLVRVLLNHNDFVTVR